MELAQNYETKIASIRASFAQKIAAANANLNAHRAAIKKDPVGYAINAYLNSPKVNKKKITAENHRDVARIRRDGGQKEEDPSFAYAVMQAQSLSPWFES